MRALPSLVPGQQWLQLRTLAGRCAWQHGPRCVATSTLPSQARNPEELGAAAPVGLAERAWALALQEGQPDGVQPGDWEVFEQQVVQYSGTLSGNDIVRILHACTIARRRPRKLLGRLRKEMLQKLPQTNSEGLCVCLHAYAQMRERGEGRLFSLATRHVLSKDTLPASQLASLLYSHVRMLFSDQKLLATAEERLISASASFDPEDLATTLQAFATMKVREMAAVAACQRTAVEHCKQPSSSLEALCDVLHALSRLAAPRLDLQRALRSRIRSSEREFRGLSAQVIVRLFHGFAGYAPRADAAFRQELGAALARQLTQLSGPYDLVQAMDAFQKAKYYESPLPELCDRIVMEMVDFSPKDVVAIATACNQLSLRDAALLEAVGRQALRKAQWLKERQLQSIIESLQSQGFRHSILGELRERAADLAEQRAAKKAPSTDDGDGPEKQKEEGLDLEEQAYFAEPLLGKESVDVTAAWKALGKPRRRDEERGTDEGGIPQNDDGARHQGQGSTRRRKSRKRTALADREVVVPA